MNFNYYLLFDTVLSRHTHLLIHLLHAITIFLENGD